MMAFFNPPVEPRSAASRRSGSPHRCTDFMHVLFVHKNFPAQFGHIARHLIDQYGFQCTFASEKPPAQFPGLERIQYVNPQVRDREDSLLQPVV